MPGHSWLSVFSFLSALCSVYLVLALFILVVIVPARAAPVPLEGAVTIDTSACYVDALIVYNLASYLISNYVIHAAAIPVGADIGRYAQKVTRQDGWRWNLCLNTISLFLPFFALSRTLILLAQQVRSKGNGVLAALQHGALLVVVRAPKWKPSTRDEFVYTKVPDEFSQQNDTSYEASLPEATIVLDADGEKHAYQPTTPDDHILHGIASPPPAYTLAIPMRKSHTEFLIETHLNDTNQLKVHYRSSIIVTLLSLVQMVIGTFSLYVSQTTQIPRWGYAAYGPYVIMSVMNLFCGVFVGSYASAQLLRTPILEEAVRRGHDKTQFDGTIGTVKNECMPQNWGTEPRSQGDYVAVRMRTEYRKNNGGSKETILVVTLNGKSREYCLVPAGCEAAGAKGTAKPVEFVVSALTHNGPPPHDTVKRREEVTPRETATIASLFLLAMILPHVVIYALTGYRPNHSTVAQRAWMMAWLAADHFSACSTLGCWIVWKKKHNVISGAVHKAWYVGLMVAGVGGFVTLAQMYLQDHGDKFQTC
ncbi:uncharacterized protein C8Q71DRAFT_761316 [Rhodofomes roseus]|uniref:Uncharacterized protein n=1 Tax=Rhodofomes roseus TaxID=34475 RepID=A0ABQ8KER7_9APHY|nr:uncharacterized protein C8Q71DRAFT_761316 [Rhodofomes roseus]KAH9836233.1 hypothetical protein C8Q71DRAFT_761316 [Rhodofomes roseus]